MKFRITKAALTREEFLTILVDQFPAIKDEVQDEDYQDLIHLQISPLQRYANKCIQQARFDEVRRIFDFFKLVVEKVDSETENALFVSFLEHVEMHGDDEKSREARKLLEPRLLKDWETLTSWYKGQASKDSS